MSKHATSQRSRHFRHIFVVVAAATDVCLFINNDSNQIVRCGRRQLSHPASCHTIWVFSWIQNVQQTLVWADKRRRVFGARFGWGHPIDEPNICSMICWDATGSTFVMRLVIRHLHVLSGYTKITYSNEPTICIMSGRVTPKFERNTQNRQPRRRFKIHTFRWRFQSDRAPKPKIALKRGDA